MKIIASIALATLLTGCASDDGCSLDSQAPVGSGCFNSQLRAPAPGVQIATGAAAQTGQHTSAKLR